MRAGCHRTGVEACMNIAFFFPKTAVLGSGLKAGASSEMGVYK